MHMTLLHPPYWISLATARSRKAAICLLRSESHSPFQCRGLAMGGGGHGEIPESPTLKVSIFI